MSDPILVKMFWKASDLDPGQGIRQTVLAAGTTSLRTFIGSRTPRWEPTIRGCFRYDDYHHMLYGSPDHPDPYPKFNLWDYADVRSHAWDILKRVRLKDDDPLRMPPPPDDRWGQTLIDLFSKWVAGGMPL